MILPNYQKIYKNYCISYFGDNFIYPIILSNLRSEIEKTYNNLNIFYCYKGIIYEKFKNKKNVINKIFAEENRNNFGHNYEIKENFLFSDLEELLNFEKLKLKIENKKINSSKCLLIKENKINKLKFTDIIKIKSKLEKKGYNVVEKVENIQEIGCVAGIECPEIFSAAFYGIPTYIFENYSININVYKKLFVNGEILN